MESVRILDLTIPFNKIEGVSARQVWYANQLREEYVRQNEERFREIDLYAALNNDRRMLSLNDYDEEYCETIGLEYTEAEKACLFGVNASGIISTLKEALKRD